MNNTPIQRHEPPKRPKPILYAVEHNYAPYATVYHDGSIDWHQEYDKLNYDLLKQLIDKKYGKKARR